MRIEDRIIYIIYCDRTLIEPFILAMGWVSVGPHPHTSGTTAPGARFCRQINVSVDVGSAIEKANDLRHYDAVFESTIGISIFPGHVG